MPAPQQNTIPTYKETAGIPRAQTFDQLHRASNKPGSALADMLGVLPGALKDFQATEKASEPGPNENAQLLALAQMGADRDRLRVAKGGGFMGLLRGEETTLDAYNVERGRREADLFAGSLRDAYATAGLHHNSDPAAFQAFVKQQQEMLFGEKLASVDPAYYHGFITRIGPVFEDMGKAHAGNLDGFLASENKQAFEARLGTKMDIELQARAENDSFGIMMDTLMGGESGGNYNAFHGNGGNTSIRFTDMTIQEVLDWQKSGAYKQYGGGSSAVGKYQFINETLAEVVRSSGIDPNTKFSPAVQDQLIMYRLLTTRKMQDFLDGNMSAEDFLDNHLSYEFAGLKSTNGRGRYDEDGLNKGNTSAAKTIAALNAYREAFVKDPRTFTDDKGRIDVASLGSPTDPNGISSLIDTVEEDFGVSQVEARDAAAEQVIQKINTDPGFAERLDLPDIIRDLNLNQEQREKVETARDLKRQEEAARKEAEAQEFEASYTDSVVNYILNGDAEAQEIIRRENPMLANELVRRGNGANTINGANPGDYIATLDLKDPYVIDEIIMGYAMGHLDRNSFDLAIKNARVHQQTMPVLQEPVIAAAFGSFNDRLPETYRPTFERMASDAIAELLQERGDIRLPTPLIIQTLKDLYAQQLDLIALDQQTIFSRPEYQ